MKYLKLEKLLKNFVVFSLNDIRKFEKLFDRRRLTEWQKKGYIKKIVKGYYVFSDIDINESLLFLIANKIFKPSYVSFESALSYYNFIPESIYAVTSANSRNTYTFSTYYGEFIYRKIKPNLMFGYKIINHKNYFFSIAEPEKAILDFLYIRKDLTSEGDFEEMRIDKEMFFENINLKKFEDYLRCFKSPTLIRRARKLIKSVKNA